MKYILLRHTDGNDPKQLQIFDTVDARARATREALIGPASDDNKDEPCPELLTLATDGIVHFEGDPSLEWIDAEVSYMDKELDYAALIAWLQAEMDLDDIAKINARDHGEWDRYHRLEGHRSGLLHVLHHLRAQQHNDQAEA